MPVLSQSAAIESLSIRGDEPFHILLTITHDDFQTLRFTNNSEDIISRSNLYSRYPFIIELPTSSDGVPTGRLRIANIRRAIWQYLSQLTTSPVFTIELVLPTNLDVVIDSYDVVTLNRISANSDAIEGELTQTIYIDKPLPASRMTPQYFPWIERS